MMAYEKAANSLSRQEKIGQLFMPAAFINDSEEEIRKLETLIREQHVGGLCFFHSRASAATNYEGKKEVVYNKDSFYILKQLIRRYQQAAKYPLLISIDAEWGLAMRIENTPQYPYAICLGAIQGSTELLYQMGMNIGKDCRQAGIHWNLAPVADINNNPDNPVIGYRSFGEDKVQVARKSLAYMEGMQAAGILTSVKHFPGHGDTATDSHLGLPLIHKSKKELTENELQPFQQVVDAGIDSVMVGHLDVPALAKGENIPSSLSAAMIKGLLRTEMGFEGVVISDALNMHAVSRKYVKKGWLEWLAFDAGNDILCFAENTVEAIKTIDEKATDKQIDLSFNRIWQLKLKAIPVDESPENHLTDPNPLNEQFALESITLHKGTPADIKQLRAGQLLGLAIGKGGEQTFFKQLKEQLKFEVYTTSQLPPHTLQNQLNQSSDMLIGVFPPQAKPQNNFGISNTDLSLLNALIDKKNVVLYLFGNPYVLNLIRVENLKALVVVYQDFQVFQETAVKHFLGAATARGKLPITIK